MTAERVCAALRDGSIWCWGTPPDAPDDAGAPLGPLAVVGVVGAVDVRVGTQHACALTAEKTLVCWGFDLYGQLGRNRQGHGQPGPVTGLVDVIAFDLGAAHTCARTRDGTDYCWGHNDFGQLGDGSTTDQYLPTKVLQP
jgi:alpha-tubulin suppressor-like RCC1 family protein